MALRALMLRKKIDAKKAEIAKVDAELEQLRTTEAELEAAIEEAAEAPEEERQEAQKAVEEGVEAYEKAKEEADGKKGDLERELAELMDQLQAEEEEQNTDPEETPEELPEEKEERKEKKTMEKRDYFGMGERAFAEMVQREDVKAYLGEVRAAMKEKRAITNVGLTIPTVMLGLLRENIDRYSKLYGHVNLRRISGKGRILVMSGPGEAIWTECCANLNEMTLGFSDWELDCYKVAGYYALCNAVLEDSDINLASEILIALGQAIGLALDKAILYGRNTAANTKMPQGIVSSLAQTAAPSGYPATARPWVDLHQTNILSIPAGTTGANLIAAIVEAFGAAKGSYSRGEKVWVMNEATYTKLMTATISVNAQGSIVTGVIDRMPVIGGIIEVLNFIPDNTIIGGYFDLYLLGERAGNEFAVSEHVRFLQDQTVSKGTARYDGAPIIREGFVAIGLNGTTPDPTDVTFAADTANTGA